MVIWVKFTHSSPFQFADSYNVYIHSCHLVWPLPICLDSWTWHSRFLWNIALNSIGPCFYHQSHPQLGILFALAPSLHSFWSYFSTDLQENIVHLLTWGVSLSVSYHFAFSYCSWGSQGKNTEVVPFPSQVDHILSDLSTTTRPSWVAPRARLSFIELDKAVVLVWPRTWGSSSQLRLVRWSQAPVLSA